MKNVNEQDKPRIWIAFNHLLPILTPAYPSSRRSTSLVVCTTILGSLIDLLVPLVSVELRSILLDQREKKNDNQVHIM